MISMRICRSVWKAIVMLLILAGSPALDQGPGAQPTHEGRVAHLSPIQQIKNGADLLPLILNPRNEAERKINATLRGRNGAAHDALAQCNLDWRQWAEAKNAHANGYLHASWLRRVQVTMFGPHYLSFLITSTAICNGSYPMNSREALVFDMKTGDPVNWSLLSLTKEPDNERHSTSSPGDGVSFSSKALEDLNLSNASAPDCKNAFYSPQPFILWPDARKGLLMAEATDLPHATQGCARPIGLTMEQVRKLGFDERLISDIAAAHKRYLTKN